MFPDCNWRLLARPASAATVVIHEPAKAKGARATFDTAGLSSFVDLHEGDLLEVLKSIEAPIDFVLFDIWEVARPVLDLLLPQLRRGAVLCTDNTAGE